MTTTDHVFDILIVDDEQDILDALALTLERAKQFKCRITTATSAEDGLKLVGSKRFDLVLADFRMGKGTGVDLLQEVKDRHPETVRVLITGYSDVEIAMQAMERAKIHYYVQKPWNNENLRLTIYEAIKRDWQPKAK